MPRCFCNRPLFFRLTLRRRWHCASRPLFLNHNECVFFGEVPDLTVTCPADSHAQVNEWKCKWTRARDHRAGASGERTCHPPVQRGAAQPEETTVPRRDECVCKNATNVKYKRSTSEHAFSKCNAVSTNCLASLESKCPRVAVERSLIIKKEIHALIKVLIKMRNS